MSKHVLAWYPIVAAILEGSQLLRCLCPVELRLHTGHRHDDVLQAYTNRIWRGEDGVEELAEVGRRKFCSPAPRDTTLCLKKVCWRTIN